MDRGSRFHRSGGLLRGLTGLALLVMGAQAFGQALIVEDGKRRYAFGAGTTFYDGNNDTSSVSLSFDAVRATRREKLNLLGKVLLSRSGGRTTGEFGQLAARYQREITASVYGFGQAEALRDTGAKIQSRFSIANGSGYRLVRNDVHKWDVFFGLGYSSDRYTAPNFVVGRVRDRYSRLELLIGQESSHQFTDNTTFRQRFSFFPNLTDSGEFRGEYDMGLSVAMSKTLSLTTTLSVRFNSAPGAGLKEQDLAFITALSWKTN